MAGTNGSVSLENHNTQAEKGERVEGTAEKGTRGGQRDSCSPSESWPEE